MPTFASFDSTSSSCGIVSPSLEFGSCANWRPHLHALVTNGVLTREGEFRETLLGRVHSGFAVHGERACGATVQPRWSAWPAMP